MLNNFYNFLIGRVNNDRGQGMIEYALIIGLVAIVVIAVLILLGPAIAQEFQDIINAL